MNKFVCGLLAVFSVVSSSAQINECTNTTGSVNAFYDALFLSNLRPGDNNCISLQALNILSAYPKNKDNTFNSNELQTLFNTALGNIFKIDSVINYFKRLKPQNNTTANLKKLVDVYQETLDLHKTIRSEKEQFEKIDFNNIITRLSVLDSNDTFTYNRLKDSIIKTQVFYLQENPTGAEALPEANEGIFTMVKNLNDFRKDVTVFYNNKLDSVEISQTEKSSKINRFVITHFQKLDETLQQKIVAIGNKGTQIRFMSLAIASAGRGMTGQADSFFYKNETYSLSNFKIPSQTELIDALAIYLAKRFKQEVALTLVDQFRKILKNDLLIKELFPETLKMFSTGKVYELPSFGSAWNYAISKDFNNLLPNLTQSTYVQSKIGDKLMVSYLQDVVGMCNLINKQFSMVDAVSNLYNSPLKNDFFKRNITTLQIINKELFDTASAARFWINAEQLYAVDQDQLEIFLALVNEKYNAKNGQTGMLQNFGRQGIDSIRNLLSSTLVLLNNFQAQQRRYLQSQNANFTTQLTDYWSFLNQLFEVLNTAIPAPSRSYEEKYRKISSFCLETYGLISQKNYAGAALRLMDIFPEIKDYNYVDIEGLLLTQHKVNRMDENGQLVLKTLREKCSDFSNTLKEYYFAKKYASEIMSLSNGDERYLLTDTRTSIFRQRSININFQVTDLKQALNRDTTRLKASLLVKKNELAKLMNDRNARPWCIANGETLLQALITDYDNERMQAYISTTTMGNFDAFRKLTGFLSDILLAGNSKNLSLVIEKYALPPNSYKIKRASHSSWDLNAYVGAYLGAEIINAENIRKPALVYGFSVPVGISYSWAKKEKMHTGGNGFLNSSKMAGLRGNAWSLTLSIIDIGAVVSYRLGNSDANKGLPRQVSWAQVLSPGLAVRTGIKDTPLCVSLGIQQTPQLRNINANNDLASVTRLYAGLFFDLPLYNISHK